MTERSTAANMSDENERGSVANFMPNRWIPVSERLPDYDVSVFAWADGYPMIAILRCDKHGDFWQDFHDGDEIDLACITQWAQIRMPSYDAGPQNVNDQQSRTKDGLVVKPPTLTYKEREAIQVARKCLLPCHEDFDETLGNLLERLG